MQLLTGVKNRESICTELLLQHEHRFLEDKMP